MKFPSQKHSTGYICNICFLLAAMEVDLPVVDEVKSDGPDTSGSVLDCCHTKCTFAQFRAYCNS